MATRSQTKGKPLVNTRDKHRDLIDLFQVRDFSDMGKQELNPFVGAIKGVAGIIHCASPLTYDVKDAEGELIKPAVRGARAMLETAAAEPKVKG